MFQDSQMVALADPTLWCVVKCGGACAAMCILDGPGPIDVVGAAHGFVDWGGK